MKVELSKISDLGHSRWNLTFSICYTSMDPRSNKMSDTIAQIRLQGPGEAFLRKNLPPHPLQKPFLGISEVPLVDIAGNCCI